MAPCGAAPPTRVIFPPWMTMIVLWRTFPLPSKTVEAFRTIGRSWAVANPVMNNRTNTVRGTVSLGRKRVDIATPELMDEGRVIARRAEGFSGNADERKFRAPHH